MGYFFIFLLFKSLFDMYNNGNPIFPAEGVL